MPQLAAWMDEAITAAAKDDEAPLGPHRGRDQRPAVRLPHPRLDRRVAPAPAPFARTAPATGVGDADPRPALTPPPRAASVSPAAPHASRRRRRSSAGRLSLGRQPTRHAATGARWRHSDHRSGVADRRRLRVATPQRPPV